MDRSTQIATFEPAFSKLQETARKLGQGVDVSMDASAVSPERALVFEVIGQVDKFAKAAMDAGFEWLGEALRPYVGVDEIEDDDDIEDGGEEDKLRSDGGDASSDDAGDEATGDTFLYLTMPTKEALDSLLLQWQKYRRGIPQRGPERPWLGLFEYLRDLRVWSAIDRIDQNTIEFASRQLRENSHVTFEIDLWFRGSSRQRNEAFERFVALIREAGGTIHEHEEIAPISYHGALVTLPTTLAMQIIERSGPIASADMIMSVRPQSLYVSVDTEEREADVQSKPAMPADAAPPIAALLDGYPVAGHEYLDGLVEVVEVDVKGIDVPVRRREHGTAMSSLVLHGDLALNEGTLSRKLAVVPILAAPQGLDIEITPQEKLPIVMVYRAVMALIDKYGSGRDAPSIVVINHSVCNEHGPFISAPSAWARLLDYLSFKFKLLFIVSAGNIRNSFTVKDIASVEEFEDHAAHLRQASIMRALAASRGRRGLLSPAESVNSLTVGAIHVDGAGNAPAGQIDPFLKVGMTNLTSATGLGFNRTVKPDFVMPGGRQAAAANVVDGRLRVWGKSTPYLGQLVAAPGIPDGDLTATRRSSGTSNAAALTTRAAIATAEQIVDVYRAEGKNWFELPTRAAILKALLAHGCRWGEIGDLLDKVHPNPRASTPKRRELVTRFVGFGRPDFERVLGGGTANRATMLADDLILPEELHEYRLPIPSAMLGNREIRTIVITLAWMMPTRANIAGYKGVALNLVGNNGKSKIWKGVDTFKQPYPDMGKRGTIIHRILSGKNEVKEAVVDGAFIGVQARALHPDFNQTRVPYALAISLEVEGTVRSDIYAEVKELIRLQQRAFSQARQQSRTRSRGK